MANENNRLITGRRDHLISFSCGDTLRYIQSEYVSGDAYANLPVSGWRHHLYQIQNNEQMSSMLDNDKLTNYYFMRDNASSKSLNDMNFPISMFDNSFLNAVKESIDNEPDNTIYYDTDSLEFNSDESSMRKLLHNNNRCYMLKDNSYRNIDGRKHYSLTQYDNSSRFNSLLSSYISINYDDYYDASHIVSDKSVPIYSIDENALHNLHVLKIENTDALLSLLKSLRLETKLSTLLFNVDTWQYDEKSFNAINIDNFLNALPINADYASIFDKLLANVRYESYYRFLNPIGKMNVALDEDSEAIEQYMYSPNLDDKSLSIDTNYFTLKNLQNPNCEYAYSIRNIKNVKSVDSKQYDLHNTNMSFEAAKYAKDVVDAFYDFIEQYSATNSYNKWLENTDDKSLYKYNAYIYDEYGINIFNPLYGYTTLRKKDAYNFLNERANEFAKAKAICDKHLTYKDNKNVLSIIELNELCNELKLDNAYEELNGIPYGLASAMLHSKNFEYIDRYLEQYKDLYSHENSMTKDGMLFGKRTYVNAMRDEQGTNYFNYRYESTYDEAFLKNKFGIQTYMIEYIFSSGRYIDIFAKTNVGKSIIEIADDGNISMVEYDIAKRIIDTLFILPNALNAKMNVNINAKDQVEKRKAAFENLDAYEIAVAESEIVDGTIYLKRISKNEVVVYSDKINEIMHAFFEMTKMTCNFENTEAMNGSYYYREKSENRSNVFSLRFNNSGLEYDAMSYQECIDYIKGILNASYDSSSRTFKTRKGDSVSLMNAMMICKIDRMLLDRSMVSYDSNKLSDDSYTYIKYNDLSELESMKKQIRTKSYLRRLLENAIRRNIAKYIPVETTLWKIEYTKNK